ncbi:type I restriction-modification system subunit M [Microbacterium hydrocarbonoxydans]|uniref:type I restriction-modification system subunit M n=1 Tax=Microbacterium hydrocarbonoxydans TaxID=273678 RepID=UPI00203E3651|nr:class I SAM-dependent DNA methyltransferase [Microbacterium hydrocarbonoxydans]MCM3778807.1 type I restriction-modification system subunit M [Microbacterium hydrocarbonoxydans]
MSNNHATFIWSIADLLRGSFKAHQYGDTILPFTVLRRLDAVLAPTKQAVFAAVEQAAADGIPVRASLLRNKAGHEYSFWNESKFDLKTALGDSENLAANLSDYVTGFSENVKDIFDKYKISERIAELDEHDLLFHVVQRFAAVDLSPTAVPNEEMGHIFEELIRKFAEASNETAGEHFTPRDVIELMVDILLAPESDTLAKKNVVRSVYDPTAGTGGMLSVAEDHIRSANPTATLTLAGQEINPQSYAICKADMTVKGQSVDAIFFGDTLINDGHAGVTFSYGLSNPPFGVDWKKQQKAVTDEHTQRGFAGRFGPGLPRVSDGSMLFLMHLISKMRSAADGGGRAAIVLNGSPLFTGGAGSGESNIRKWVLERDLLEAIIALPTDMFYNTGIATYIWVLASTKKAERAGKVQLIDGTKLFRKMRKGLGSKRNELGPDDIAALVRLYEGEADKLRSKTFANEDFFYRTITVERPLRLNWALTPDRLAVASEAKTLAKVDLAPLITVVERAPRDGALTNDLPAFRKHVAARLADAEVVLTAPQLKALIAGLSERDENAPIVLDAKKRPEPDPTLRDTENVPWNEDIHAYFAREVTPFAPDAWIDEAKTKDGCEIPFTRHFYQYVPPRSLAEIDADLDRVLGRIRARLEAVKA